jgi:hypothetical protein
MSINQYTISLNGNLVLNNQILNIRVGAMRTENLGNTNNANENNTNTVKTNEVNRGQACCGRSYNEESDFSQVNFAAFQSILDKRNELLSGVKAHRQP